MKRLMTAITTATSYSKITAIPTKHELCLLELLEAGLNGICKLTALSAYGDTCLSTTISEIGIQRGLLISRELRPHTHRHGGKAHFNWYWFATRNEATEGLEIVNKLREIRKLPPVDPLNTGRLLKQYPIIPFTPAA